MMAKDAETERGFEKIQEFRQAHPEITDDQLALWMASGATLEATDPEAAAICAREVPELKG